MGEPSGVGGMEAGVSGAEIWVKIAAGTNRSFKKLCETWSRRLD